MQKQRKADVELSAFAESLERAIRNPEMLPGARGEEGAVPLQLGLDSSEPTRKVPK